MLAIECIFFLNFLKMSTQSGKSSNGPEKDYSLIGDTTNRLFGIFNAIPIVANTYGCGIVPEIQVRNNQMCSL